MQKIFNPKWLFLVNTLPIAILFFLLFEQFNIIKTLLNENALWLWKTFGISLGALGILNFVYAVYLTVKKQRVSVLYGIIALVCHIAFIYSYGFNFGYILPRNIPGWMILDSLPLYVFTFLMPTLAYSLFVLVIHFTPETKEHKASRNFLITISIPVGAYLFIQIIFPLIRFDFFKDYFHIHILTVSFIVITLVFFFFLVRSIFIIAAKKAHVWKKYQLAWKTPIALVLPLLGLWVNNTHKGEFFSPKFGNFSNHWFYILALLNGILICLPNIENKIYRMPLFALRSMTFAYTFYFFLVFLPISPLSIIAIIFVGLGFLMLTPLLLFIIHIAEISKDFEYLKTWFSKKSLIAISVLCFMVIPMCITVTYMKDKSVLNEALEYLYAPDYSKQ
ncbi:MAG: MSEP-CTERM sorting domain-containing protein, partial [Fibromonadaceae bacterium]|nr:MSEP-CTERM sorting domain-containing protein [Fibromonadaceae bacterium]